MEPMKPPNATPKQWTAVSVGVLGAFISILNISITNSSLMDIQGALGAGITEGSWISTAYLVTEIIVIPLTGFLCGVFSTRLYMLGNVLLFILFSAFCGMSQSLPAMILMRALQGFVGGALIPVGMTLAMDSLPKHQRTIGLSLFGLATTFAPAIGPTLGGWLTTHYGWPFVFYINIIPGVAILAAILASLDPEPHRLGDLRTADWPGIISLSAFLGSLTTVLEQGNQEDWFSSPMITRLTILCLASLIYFIWRELNTPKPVVDLSFLVRLNFLTSCLLSLAMGLVLYTFAYLMPVYLGGVQGYNALQIGGVMTWFGLPQLAILPMVPYLVRNVDNRKLVAAGFALMAAGSLMNIHMNHDCAGSQFIIPQCLLACGMPLLIVPLTSIAYDGITFGDHGAASGLFNMTRNLGGSIGIGTMQTLVTRRYIFHFGRIAEKVSALDPAVQYRLAGVTKAAMAKGSSAVVAHQQAIQMFGMVMNRESYVMAFSDCFLILGLLTFLAVLLTPMLHRVKGEMSAAH